MQSRRRRAFALTAGGAFAVHQLRYLLAYGHDSGHRLAAQGHAYLTPLMGVVALALGLGAGAFLLRLARGRAVGSDRGRAPLHRSWAATSGALIGLYCLQESLEGLLERGHTAGWPGVLGGGGWVAVPLSIVIGLLIALALRGADAAIELVVRLASWSRRRALPVVFLRPAAWPRRVVNVAARHLAGRSPPPASV